MQRTIYEGRTSFKKDRKIKKKEKAKIIRIEKRRLKRKLNSSEIFFIKQCLGL